MAAHQFDWYGLVADLRGATNVLPCTSGRPFMVAIDLPKPEPASRFLTQLSLEGLEKAIESGDGLAVLRHLREELDQQPPLVAAWIRRRLQLAHFGREGRDSQFDAYRRCLTALGDHRLVTSKRLASAVEAGLIECGRSRLTRSESIGEVVVVRPSSGFGVPRPSWVLNSFTVSRRAAVALARKRPQGKQIWRFRLGPRFGGAAQGKPGGLIVAALPGSRAQAHLESRSSSGSNHRS